MPESVVREADDYIEWVSGKEYNTNFAGRLYPAMPEFYSKRHSSTK
jgi:hypothetical protein